MNVNEVEKGSIPTTWRMQKRVVKKKGYRTILSIKRLAERGINGIIQRDGIK